MITPRNESYSSLYYIWRVLLINDSVPLIIKSYPVLLIYLLIFVLLLLLKVESFLMDSNWLQQVTQQTDC